MTKKGCGKLLHKGEQAIDYHGQLLCRECNFKQRKTDELDIYWGGKLTVDAQCGTCPQS